MELQERQSATPCGNLAATFAAIGNPEPECGNLAEESAGYTIPEAARLLAWSERTLRDRVKKGKIPAQSTERGYLIAAAVVESLRQPPATFAASDCGNLAANGESDSLNGARHRLSEPAASIGDPPNGPPIDDELRDRLTDQAEEIRFLRDQLQQERGAGQELRVMLARLERTNAEVAGALVQRALPPASTPGDPPRKVRWWWPWRR